MKKATRHPRRHGKRGLRRYQGIWLWFLVVIFWAVSSFGREVEFTWDPVDGAIGYDIQVAPDSKFEKPLVNQQIEKPNFSTPLGMGRYFYRVRSHDKKGRPGRWSAPVSVTVNPYSPELISPESGFETSYYEILPTIEFTWKPLESKPEYEILVSRDSGQVALQQKTKETRFTTNKLPEGEYTWKVRSVAQGDFLSPYSNPWKFTVKKKPLKTPVLLTPEKDGVSPAYRRIHFTWEKDPATQYTDLYFERVSGRVGEQTKPEKVSNLTGSSYDTDYVEPGIYKWHVVTKEGKDTPGVSSETWSFEVRNDVITRGNIELEFSMSPVSDYYVTNSQRFTGISPAISQSSKGSGTMFGFLGGYYFFENLGFYLSTRTGNLNVENFSGSVQETDLQLRLRFGVPGFNQEFWYGYRIMDIVEAENNPSQTSTDITALGALLGTRMNATIVRGIKAQVSLFYYKPTSSVEGISTLTSDVFGGSVGAKWNFLHEFWLGYRYQYTQLTNSFTTPGRGPAFNASWTQYRSEYFNISLTYEH